MSRIFISYSREDKDFARRLATDLDRLQADVWIDVDDIQAGVKWSTAVQDGLDSCDVMIVIISPDSMASRHVEDEWQTYLDEGKPVIPVRWRPVERVHFQLRRIQYVDFHEQEYDAAFQKLCVELARFEKHQEPATGSRPEPAKPRALRVTDILPPPFEWVNIPAGVVVLEDAREFGGTKGGRYEIPSFAIAKYPLTNAQYQVFVDADDGYGKVIWWGYSDEAKAWRKENPQPSNTGFSGDQLPRTKVCWYEAVAFCHWLGDKLGRAITLPTEQQWQRAAQGDDGREYPWGNKFNLERSNVETRNGPTPITQYPNRASPYNVMDMGGNVSQWCLTAWGTNNTALSGKERRVLRGGSWWDYQDDIRCVYRYHLDPGYWDSRLGFRLACASPIAPDR